VTESLSPLSIDTVAASGLTPFLARVDGTRVREAAFKASLSPEALRLRALATLGGETRGGTKWLVEGSGFADLHRDGRRDYGVSVMAGFRW